MKNVSLRNLVLGLDADLTLSYDNATWGPADLAKHLEDKPHESKHNSPVYIAKKVDDQWVIHETYANQEQVEILTQYTPSEGEAFVKAGEPPEKTS